MIKSVVTSLFSILLMSLTTLTNAQNNPSQLFQEWVNAQGNNNEPILPNFSYAGYHYGETGLPTSFTQTIYDVTNAAYGAVPNDGNSDKAAIIAAIAAAELNPSGGIVFFPPGEFLINEITDDIDQIIRIRKSNIVLKGSGSGEGGTILTQNNYTNPTTPENFWSCPYLIQFKPSSTSRTFLSNVSANATRETFSIELESSSNISVGDWVRLRLSDNTPALVASEFFPYPVNADYTNINNEVTTLEMHKVAEVIGNTIRFEEPIHKTIDITYNWYLEKIPVIEEVGIQDLYYKGGLTETFDHHLNWQHDSGWSGIQFNQVVNSWIKNITFSQMSNAAQLKLSGYCSAIQNEYIGNPGHAFISGNVSTGCLIGFNKDLTTGVHHNCGIAGGAIGNVLWRNEFPTNGNSGVEIHASQPRCNLIDLCTGGLGMNYGGAEASQPNHLKHLVIWNFEGVGYTNTNFEFWRNNYTYAKIIPPIVSGLVGFTISEDTSQSISGSDKHYQENESPGVHVDEASLYEAQLSYRLGFLPGWISDLGKVTGVKLSTTSLKLEEQQSITLISTVLPANAIDKSVSWSSSNNAIATVSSNGIVTGISEGNAVVTVTTIDGDFTENCQVTISSLGTPIEHLETFNNMDFTGWSTDSYTGDNGFIWNIDAKSTTGYIDETKEIYMRSGKTGALSELIPGGISSFSISCKDLWDAGKERTLELIINGSTVDTFTHTGSEVYTYTVNNINIEGDVTIGLKNSSPTDSNKSIAVDNLTWTTYSSPTASSEDFELFEIKIFPNPFQEKFTIQSGTAEVKEIVMMDMQGRIVLTQKTKGFTQFTISPDRKKIPSGIYFLKVKGPKTTRIFKLIRN